MMIIPILNNYILSPPLPFSPLSLQDFEFSAKQYAMIIINERNLPEKSRTIPPIKSLGGYAGGEKYFRGGILFKFAIDQFQGNCWMYGGKLSLFIR